MTTVNRRWLYRCLEDCKDEFNFDTSMIIIILCIRLYKFMSIWYSLSNYLACVHKALSINIPNMVLWYLIHGKIWHAWCILIYIYLLVFNISFIFWSKLWIYSRNLSSGQSIASTHGAVLALAAGVLSMPYDMPRYIVISYVVVLRFIYFWMRVFKWGCWVKGFHGVISTVYCRHDSNLFI